MSEVSSEMNCFPSLEKTASSKCDPLADSRSYAKNGIATAIKTLLRLAKYLAKKLAVSDDDDDDYSDIFDRFIRHLVKASEGELADWRDLEDRVVTRFHADVDVCTRRDFGRLSEVCRLARAFDSTVQQVRQTLEAALREADVHLASHSHEAASHNFASVCKYERTLTSCRDSVINGLEKIHNLSLAVKGASPLSRYLTEHAKVRHYMQEACQCAEACARSLQRWTTADDVYVNDISNELHALQQKKRQQEHSVLTKTSLSVIASNRNIGDMHMVREQIRCDERRLRDLRNNLSSVEEELKTAQRALDAKLSQRSVVQRGLRTHRLDSGMLKSSFPQVRSVDDDISALRASVNALHAQKRELADNIDDVVRAEQLSRHELHQRDRAAGALQERVVKSHRRAAARLRNSRKTDDMLEALQRLLALKRSRQVLKTGSDVAQSVDFTLILEEAILWAAQIVGKKWPLLYASLTFVPERSEEHLLADINGIHKLGTRLGYDVTTLAKVALTRWTKVTSAASVGELTFVAKKVVQPGQLCRGCGNIVSGCTTCKVPRIGPFSSLLCN